MRFERTGNTINGDMEGPIGETCVLFTYKMDAVTEILLDMTKVTSINSIGVKHWIMWTMKIPYNCQVKLINCPYVIASQASMVMGFITDKITIESFRAPFACEECAHEGFHTLTRGQEYEYASKAGPSRLTLPMDLICNKCRKGKLEPDFLLSKTFKFLG